MIYFVRAGAEGAIKIGFSSNPDMRIDALRTAVPEDVRVLAVIKGTQGEEQRLHAVFEHAHLRGEWFKPTPDLLAYIAQFPPYDNQRVRARNQRGRKKRLLTPGANGPITPMEIRRWREQLGWTQARAAHAMGLKLRTYQNWEQGHRPMPFPHGFRIQMEEINRQNYIAPPPH